MLEDASRRGALDEETLGELHDAAYIDPLTGAYNRLFLEEYGQDLFARSRSLLSFKLDELKEINDGYGHAVGDHYLAETTDIISRIIGPDAVLIRRNPTKFAVFTDVNARSAQLLAEALRLAVAHRLAHKASPVYNMTTHEPVRSSIQIGLAKIRGSSPQERESALLDAETSRKNAKEAGGNIVADSSGNLLLRTHVNVLLRKLSAAGLPGIAQRFQQEIRGSAGGVRASDPSGRTGEFAMKRRLSLEKRYKPPTRKARALDVLLRDIQDRPLRASFSDFFFRNPLSGLHNALWLERNAAAMRAAGRAARYAALDLDKFGEIDRSLGEERADRVLACFGRILGGFARERSVEALHLSGEEFALLIGQEEQDVQGLLEALRRRVEEQLGPKALSEEGIAGLDGKALHVTVSIGEALIKDSQSPLPGIRSAAERAEVSLTQAKTQGRNRVVLEK